MKKCIAIILLLSLLLTGCAAKSEVAEDRYVYTESDSLYAPEYGFSVGSDNVSNRYPSLELNAAPVEKPEASEEKTDAGQGVQSQKLIRKIYLEAETNELDEFMANITSRIDLLGGYVEDKSVRTGSSSRYATLTIRIPVDRLDEFVEHVTGASNILYQTESADDVTLSYVATQSRITALETEQTRLLELLAKAENMSDLLLIEERLTNVRYELEQVTSQLRLYDNLVDYGTVELSVREVKEYTPVAEETVWQRISGGFVKSLANMGSFLTELFVSMIVAIPYLVLPVVIVVLLVVLLRRKRKAKKANQTPKPESET